MIWPLAYLELGFLTCMLVSSVKWRRRCCCSNKHWRFFSPTHVQSNTAKCLKPFNETCYKGPLHSRDTLVHALIWNHHQPSTLGKWRYRTACFQPLHLSWKVWIFSPFPGAIDSSCSGQQGNDKNLPALKENSKTHRETREDTHTFNSAFKKFT